MNDRRPWRRRDVRAALPAGTAGRRVGVLPGGVWLAAARLLMRVLRLARATGLLAPRSTFGWVRRAGRLYRRGFDAWRRNGGKWR